MTWGRADFSGSCLASQVPVLQAEGSRASVAQGEMIYWNYAQAHSGKQEDGKGTDRLERIKPGMKKKGWRDRLVLKSICCSIARTRIQVPSSTSGGLQMPVTPAPKDLMMPFPIFYGHTRRQQAHKHTQMEQRNGTVAGTHCAFISHKLCLSNTCIPWLWSTRRKLESPESRQWIKCLHRTYGH